MKNSNGSRMVRFRAEIVKFRAASVSRAVWLFLLLSVLLLDPATSMAEQASFIKLERLPCLGLCPSYELTILSDGSVQYFGRGFVKVEGAREERISSSEVEKLFNSFRKARVQGIKEITPQLDGEGGATTLKFSIDGVLQSITYFDRASDGVLELVGLVDEIAKKYCWVN